MIHPKNAWGGGAVLKQIPVGMEVPPWQAPGASTRMATWEWGEGWPQGGAGGPGLGNQGRGHPGDQATQHRPFLRTWQRYL